MRNRLAAVRWRLAHQALVACAVILLVIFTAIPVSAQSSGGPPADGLIPVFTDSAPPGGPVRIDGKQVMRKRFVTVDAQAVIKSPELSLNLFEGVQFHAQSTRRETIGRNGKLWIGVVPGFDGRVTLVAVDDVLLGNIRVGEHFYQIRYAGEKTHVTYEIDPALYPLEQCPEVPLHGGEPYVKPDRTPGSEDGGARDPAPDSDPCDLIDVLVVYTPSAKSAEGGATAMEALVYLAVAETNTSYDNSGVTQRLGLVHLKEVSYTESGSFLTDVNRLRNPSDGFIDEVHTWRERYCADLVLMLINDDDYCGRAYDIQDPAPDPGFESNAFAVVHYDCATGYYSFGHEAGHLMGARHDWYADATHSPFSYSHGYVDRLHHWRTIMAYNKECSDAGTGYCTRLDIWSNPDVSVSGDPAGVYAGTSTACSAGNLSNPDCDAENWQTLNDTACTVANFRDRSECADRSDVWMKDTWTDTGEEPDPLTASESMWKSPYIWVRNDQDPDRLEQHRHQNPEFGQVNYVYVKVHNDYSGSATGHLKLYYASASTGLSWPGDWTLISDDSVSIPANDTAVFESTWDPPGTGHYCLLARWDVPNVPADPMTFPEGSSVGDNTRNNNNIVWRNVNVVDVLADTTTDVSPALVHNTFDYPTRIDLRILLGDTPFNLVRAGGRVILNMGELYDLWHQGGAEGRGVLDLGDGRVEILDTEDAVSELYNISLEPGQTSEVFFTITAPKTLNVPAIGHDDEAFRYCSRESGIQIPDNDPQGVTDAIYVGECFLVDKLMLEVKTVHSYVGDLRYELTKTSESISVVPIDRPGVPDTAFGCSGDDIEAELERDAASPVEDECAATVPTIAGSFIPGDPPDPNLFDVFRGIEMCGEWTLQVADLAERNAGYIDQWCLLFTSDPVPGGPVTDYQLDLIQVDQQMGEIGGVGYDVRVTPLGGVGAVPNGWTIPGQQLSVVKVPGGVMRLSWDVSCLDPEDVHLDYAVYEGTLGSYMSDVPERCSTGGVTSAMLPLAGGSRYYLVVPHNGYFEGSHGEDSTRTQRPVGPVTCLAQDFAGCP